MLYGYFRHLVIRKSGPGYRLDRIDKNPDLDKRKKFKENVTIEVKKEVMVNIDKKERERKAQEQKRYEQSQPQIVVEAGTIEQEAPEQNE